MTLDQLSAAATRARVLESRVNNRWQVTLDFGSDKDAMRRFSDAYRTGQLVAVADDAVERVGMALCQSALGPKQCPCAESGVFKCADEYPGQQAKAAIAAMKDTQP